MRMIHFVGVMIVPDDFDYNHTALAKDIQYQLGEISSDIAVVKAKVGPKRSFMTDEDFDDDGEGRAQMQMTHVVEIGLNKLTEF